jgi:uncharacterized protein YndB with AHSA1/START domain
MSAEDSVVIRRRIPATQEELFDAWTDPQGMALWMCPGSITRSEVTLELRTGGSIVILMHEGDRTYEHRGVFLAIERPNKLAFTWTATATDHQETLVTIEFVAIHQRETELILTHDRFPRPEGAERYRGGWSQIIDRFGRHLAGEA